MRKCLPAASIFTDCLRRLLRGSVEVQMEQEHPMTGTPVPSLRKAEVVSMTNPSTTVAESGGFAIRFRA